MDLTGNFFETEIHPMICKIDCSPPITLVVFFIGKAASKNQAYLLA